MLSSNAMWLKSVAALVIAFAVVSCGGYSTPTAPASTTPAPAPTGVDLVAGTYALTLTMSQQGAPVCNPNDVCVSISLCGGVGGPPSANSATVVVRLDRSGDAITLRPDDTSASFRMDLRIAGSAVTGTASGNFQDGTMPVTVGPGQSPARVTGTLLPASVTGSLDGQVDIGGYGCSNNGHTWRLVPR